jgi:hypothetical protein
MVVTMRAQNAWCSRCNVPMTLSDDDLDTDLRLIYSDGHGCNHLGGAV